jgi:hypothetical protein
VRKWLWNAYLCVRPHTRRRDRWLDLVSVETTPKKANPPKKGEKKNKNKTLQTDSSSEKGKKTNKRYERTLDLFLSKLRRKRAGEKKKVTEEHRDQHNNGGGFEATSTMAV